MSAATLPFQVYLVGGAVRDELLGRTVNDRDYVVVGASAQDLVQRGFMPVGKDFPVFLHPESKEEYALARTERKQGHGYHGFTFNAAPSVTLEEDLARRDLTINAMARAASGRLIDPYNGLADLEQRCLRHVSPAFAEDPLRILRVARFAARFAHLGFTIAPETMALMQHMVDNGEVNHLVAERVWAEMHKALAEPDPDVFIRSLRACGALKVLLPEVDALYGIPQSAKSHPEIDTGIHVELVLQRAAAISPGDALLGFCALTHDLGKAVTPVSQWPRHAAHEAHGVPLVEALCQRLKVPRDYAQMAVIACREHLAGHRCLTLDAAEVLDLLERLDVWRRPQRLRTFTQLCQADSQGRKGYRDHPYPQADFLHRCYAATRDIRAQQVLQPGMSGMAIGRAIREARIECIHAIRQTSADNT